MAAWRSKMVMPSAELTWAPVLRVGWVARLGSSCHYLTKDDGCWLDQGSGIGDGGMWWVLPSFSWLTQLNILMDSTWGVRHRGHRLRCSRFWGLRLGFLRVNIKDYLLDFQAEMLRKQLGMKLRKEVWDQFIDLEVGTCLVVSFNVFNSGVSLGRGERAWAPVASKPRGCREEKQEIEAEEEKSPGRQKTGRQDALDAKRRKYLKEEWSAVSFADERSHETMTENHWI